jgi:hypothetical protein
VTDVLSEPLAVRDGLLVLWACRAFKWAQDALESGGPLLAMFTAIAPAGVIKSFLRSNSTVLLMASPYLVLLFAREIERESEIIPRLGQMLDVIEKILVLSLPNGIDGNRKALD